MTEGMQEEAPQRSARPSKYQWILVGLLVALGVTAFVWMWRTGRADSALLFVGLPALLAVALILAPTRTGHGRAFQLTTVGLLVASILFHEGAICVLLAAPIVYAIVHGAIALHRSSAGRQGLLLIPVLLVASLEGTNPGLRVDADQAITVTRTIALSESQVRQQLEQGPRRTNVRSLPLSLLQVPMPVHVEGQGLEPGDGWTFHYHGSSHGPGGQTRTRVTATTPTSVEFGVEENTTITARWVGLERAVVSWQPAGDGRTHVRLTIWYERKLDPSWYFGPLQQGFMHEGAGYLLDSLGLR